MFPRMPALLGAFLALRRSGCAVFSLLASPFQPVFGVLRSVGGGSGGVVDAIVAVLEPRARSGRIEVLAASVGPSR